jgi:tetratricopeptide (TPR) repeat protein
MCLQGRYEEALQIGSAIVKSARAAKPWLAAEGLERIGDVLLAQGQPEAAEEKYLESLTAFEAVQNAAAAVEVQVRLANMHRVKGDHDRARLVARECMRRREQASLSARIAAHAHLCLGDVEREQGHTQEALAQYHRALELSWRIEHLVGVADCLERVGWAAASGPSSSRSVVILASAERLRATIGMALAPIDTPAHEVALQDLRGGMGEAEYAQGWAMGDSMDSTDAVSFALSQDLD